LVYFIGYFHQSNSEFELLAWQGHQFRTQCNTTSLMSSIFLGKVSSAFHVR
jgi:hypothetical protein